MVKVNAAFKRNPIRPFRFTRNCVLVLHILTTMVGQAVGVGPVSELPELTPMPLVSVIDPTPPPSLTYIWTQPTSANAILGGTAGFWVQAYTDVSSEGPDPTITLHYRWFKNSTNLVGRDLAYLNFSNVQPSDAGSYHVVVSNAYGTAVSDRVNLTVVLPPLVSLPPQPIIGQYSSNAAFFVQVSGTPPFSYQWLANGQFVAGATNASLTLSNLVRALGGSYSVVVSNVSGSVTSSPAALRVLVPQRLAMPQRLPGGRLRLTFCDMDGGFLSEAGNANFEVQMSTNLFSTNWVRFTNGFSLTNGLLLFDDIEATNLTSRFYRVIER